MLSIYYFIADKYTFNTEGWIFSTALLVVSICIIILGYNKGINKISAGNNNRTLWQVLFYIGLILISLALFFFYIHFSSFKLPYWFSFLYNWYFNIEVVFLMNLYDLNKLSLEISNLISESMIEFIAK